MFVANVAQNVNSFSHEFVCPCVNLLNLSLLSHSVMPNDSQCLVRIQMGICRVSTYTYTHV